MDWSKEQQAAIDVRHNNVIVSASAGSGKTAVLVERIVDILKKDYVNINNLLVLTFTNAAAAEMKKRVRSRIKEEPELKDMIDLVDTSKIMTFDAYSLYLVKKYYYRLNIDPNIDVADSYYLSTIIEKKLDEIFEALYKVKDPLLTGLFNAFPSRDDNTLKANIIKMYYPITLFPNSYKFLDEYNDNFYNDQNIDRIVKLFEKYLINEINKNLSNFYDIKDEIINLVDEEMEYLAGDDKLIEKYYDSQIKEFLENFDFIDEDSGYEDIIKYLRQNKFPSNKNVRNKPELGEIKKKITENKNKCKFFSSEFNSFIKKLYWLNTTEIKEDIYKQKPYSDLFIKVIRILLNEIDKYMKENNYYDFTGISKLAIKLVEENEDIKNELKNGLYEILIDEYQDTSDLQEYFISLVANKNVFMVGDIKQSIYRFRNANPYIFKEKYDRYKKGIDGVKIDFTKNFRSREEVINNINLIFNELMTQEYGDANYKTEHQMVFGLNDYNKIKLDTPFDFDIIRYDSKAMKEKNNESEDSNEGTEKDDFKCTEIEAFYIAKDILKRINSGEIVYDKEIKEDNKFRKCTFSDFCIIMDRDRNFDLFKKILISQGIPVAINANLRISRNEIALVISSLVKFVALQSKNMFNNDYYHALMSIGRSYLFSSSSVTDETLFDIVMSSKKSPNQEPINNIITEKAREIVKDLDVYSNYDIYIKILETYECLQKLPLVGDIEENMIVIEYLGNFISSISNTGKTFFEISELIDGIFDNEDSATYKIDVENVPGVKIMNIHKSKGLEFPICYFSMIGIKPKQEGTLRSGFYQETGFYFKEREDDESMLNVIEKSALYLNSIKNISEKIRLFYVALTRTREKMIIITDKYEDSTIKPSNFSMSKDYLQYVNQKIKKYIKDMDMSQIDLSKDYLSIKKKDYSMINEKPIYEEKSYLGNIITKSRISKDVIEILSDDEQENIDLGLKLHYVMEMIDFKNPDFESIKDNFIKGLVTNIFKHNPLFKDINKAKTYHEHEFIMETDKNTYHGIIDLLCIYDDHIDIIDYKLSNIDHQEYDRQLSIYKEYVQKEFNSGIDKKEIKINCYLLSLLTNNVRKVE